jgi:hypothetical protein
MVRGSMIETWESFLRFIELSMNDDLLFQVVPLHDEVHSAINSPSILFIRNFAKGKTFYYGFDHPDVKTPQPVDHERVIEALSTLKGKKWAVDKKGLMHMVPIRGLYDIGFAEYLREKKVFEVSEFDTPAHEMIRKRFNGKQGFGKFVPLVKHLEAFNELSETCEKTIKKTRLDDAFDKFHTCIIDPLTETEKNGLAVDPSIFSRHFGNELGKSGRVYTQYFFYTSTGRPSNRFGGVNYAALNKDDGSRKAFISRHGVNGKLLLIDYSAFHPRIIALLTDYNISTEVDIYEYLAKLYFNKSVVDETDISDAKQITFRQLFGGVENKYQHIKYLSHLKEFIDYHWSFFNQNKYVETPIFKRRITDKHIQVPKPATVFNYLLQAVEGEISIPVLGTVNELLRTTKTKAILYTYDSILFDYHFDDDTIMTQVRQIMSLGGKFPMKVYVGDNYHEMELVA